MAGREGTSPRHRRIVATRYGGPEVLQVLEEDLPEPGAGEVRVKVQAAGVSGYDVMLRQSGAMPGSPRVPFTPGTDVVGVVDRVGEGVTTVEPGQTVAGATFSLGGTGGYAEYVCLPTTEVVPVPGGLDPVKTVCMVTNYVTAHMAMYRLAKIQSGERVLVHGAAGGVGTALLDLGRLAGLEMYGTASKHNHEVVSTLGATPIDYRTEDFVKRIRSLTGDGVDAVLDPVGGPRHVWRSYRALGKGGRLAWFGMAATKKSGMRVIPLTLAMLLLLKLIPDGKHALFAEDISKDSAWFRATLAELLNLLAEGQLEPVVAERLPLMQAIRAHQILDRGGYAGKLVLVTGA